ncbi:MAG TPA: class I SAM-dependent methyltransferase [Candidatus Angelobacter sp.]|nr:class I SAM-dependent methyltransferase [Candidatus Angelobacter sp.]
MALSAGSVATAQRVLAHLGAELRQCPGVELEFSVRLLHGKIEFTGRFGCWLPGNADTDFGPVLKALQKLDAPEEVLQAQKQAVLPVRQGIAVALQDGIPEFRIYLHGRGPHTLADHYQAWRWGLDGEVRRSRYEFHFLPESPSGLRPLDLIAAELRPALAQLLAVDRLQQSSGFWLRRDENDQLEQLDLALPWNPAAGSLPGLQELAQQQTISKDELQNLRELPIRHLAVSLDRGHKAVTLYASAAVAGNWPETEDELQHLVRHNAQQFQVEVEDQLFRRLPHLPSTHVSGTDAAELGGFYDGDVSQWRKILGDELHYHAGLFETPGLAADDEAMTTALRRAVSELYPFLPAGGRVYDIGCGWGGPMAMIVHDLQCRSLGLTISRTQYRYIASMGLPVRMGDAEQTLPPGLFDCALLLESLSHIRNKARLLRILRPFANRLVMRVNCQDASPPGAAFGDTMHMISSSELRKRLEESGWQIKHWRDRRLEALPSVAVWQRRLRLISPGEDRHLETLRAWCDRIMIGPEEWGRNNPLIEVVAD